MRADEYLKKKGLDDDNEELKDTSLKGKSLERATHPEAPKAGTPHDWEDWEAFKASEKRKEEAGTKD
ncbi:MAG TPA: peptidase S14 [Pseudomonas xinjiangensis]|uniref:Peptidase S14 n=2 Tax=root TaxID=1 RepID=A0A7V1BLU6_9GAMM|nr:peptidase S14 [Halopseudomonas xinjiangensis]HEC46109.1 peptidase S14 [Halopseudomonas xinjiangensis]